MNNSLSYRSEINGLRGIAILWVTIFHFEKIILDLNFFQGGYIGLDIFFVISGYLISTIIFKELKAKGNFSYKNFYTRRVKRLLPVLAIVIIFTLITAYILFIPYRFSYTLDTAFFSWLFISNFFFWTSGRIYGADHSTI